MGARLIPRSGISARSTKCAPRPHARKKSPRRKTRFGGCISTNGQSKRPAGSRWPRGTRAKSIAPPLAGRRCFVGLDLSSTTDLTAAVAVFPDGDHFDVLAHFFVPAERIPQRVTRDRVPYDQWAREGKITATPGPVVDYDYVRKLLLDWDREFDLRVIAYDPWNATDLITRLEKQDGLQCVKIRQGFASLSAPSKSLETAILARTLRHDGDPVLRWNIANISVVTDDAGNIKPSKELSTERIDGGYALMMAIDAMERNDHTPPPSYQMIIFGGP